MTGCPLGCLVLIASIRDRQLWLPGGEEQEGEMGREGEQEVKKVHEKKSERGRDREGIQAMIKNGRKWNRQGSRKW